MGFIRFLVTTFYDCVVVTNNFWKTFSKNSYLFKVEGKIRNDIIYGLTITAIFLIS